MTTMTMRKGFPSLERQMPPVEMRFVDMFMSAFGALIFMAMLLAFVFRYIGPPAHPQPVLADAKRFEVSPITITTRMLPPARVGERFEAALAFNGGMPPARWDIVAGASEMPVGLEFDREQGLISGTPRSVGTARFVAKVTDQTLEADSKPFDLVVLPVGIGDRRAEQWLALFTVAVLLGVWARPVREIRGLSGLIRRLREHQMTGGGSIVLKGKGGIDTTIDYGGGGIETLNVRLRSLRRQAQVLFCVVLAAIGFSVWRFWVR